MTETGSPDLPEVGEQVDTGLMLSDGEIEEVVAEAITTEVVAEAERDLLGSSAAGTSDAERRQRLEADRRMVEMLRSTGFTGRQFEMATRRLMGDLMAYAHPVLRSMLTKGTIFSKAFRFRHPIAKDAKDATARWTAEERDEAIDDAMVVGSKFFLDYGIKAGKWDHRRGAALTTYFVGACICGFIKVCNERWKIQQLERAFVESAPHRETEHGVYEDLVHAIPARGVEGRDPAEVVAARDEATRTLAKIKSSQVREALLLQADGMTQAEAATAVGLTRKGLERRLAYQRSKLRPPTKTDNTEDEG
ncbi:hypothetical protein GCM10010492_10030 [Saccharothrix mutabilis subsp. mutabilis]|uniref:Sigma-70 family RNA polymerase sigma factor n=1 Tax=Saccharothrix mutabilis subsp. mutabilis TaxID=66855 RepID=A0ABP3CSH0_9PSEU